MNELTKTERTLSEIQKEGITRQRVSEMTEDQKGEILVALNRWQNFCTNPLNSTSSQSMTAAKAWKRVRVSEVAGISLQHNGQILSGKALVRNSIKNLILGLLQFLGSKTNNTSDPDFMANVVGLRDRIINTYGKQISLTGLQHCFDLIKSGKYPLIPRKNYEHLEFFGFEPKKIMDCVREYLEYQIRSVKELEPVSPSLAERSDMIGALLREKPEMLQKFTDLRKKLDARAAKKGISNLPANDGKYNGVKMEYETLEQYAEETGKDWGEWQEDLQRQWREKYTQSKSGVTLSVFIEMEYNQLLRKVNRF